MKNNFKVLFWQDVDDINSRYKYEINYDITYNSGDEVIKLCKLFATYELIRFFKLMFNLQIKTFNLRKPLFANVYCDDKLTANFVQVSITKDRILRKDFDYPYPLKAKSYLLIDIKEFIPSTPLKNEKKSSFTVIDFNKLYNTVDYQLNQSIKYGSPIIYTGMIN